MSDNQQFVINEELTPVKININPKRGKEYYATHVFKRPTFEDEELRERTSPIITEESGKVDGQTATKQTVDDERANLKFYDKLITTVAGYTIKGSKEPIDARAEIDEKLVLDLIPSNHKLTAVSGLYRSTMEVDLGEEDDEEFSFDLGASREWRVVQKIGGQYMLEDATMAPPDYVVTYVLREPSEAERAKYRAKAMGSSTYTKKGGGRVSRASTNLKVVTDLFDALITRIEGAAFKTGEETIPVDAKNPDHVKSILASFKLSVIITLFNALEADLEK